MAITAMAAPKLDRAPGSLVLTPALSASWLDTMGDLITTLRRPIVPLRGPPRSGLP